MSPSMAVPVIFISRLNESGDVIGGLRSGAIDYIRKPFESGEVLARIGTVLRFHTVELEERRDTARKVHEMLRLAMPPHVVQVRTLTTTGFDHKTPLRTSFDQRLNRYSQLCLPQSERPHETTRRAGMPCNEGI